MVGVGGTVLGVIVEAEAERRTVTLFMRPNPADNLKDREAIAVELVSARCHTEGVPV